MNTRHIAETEKWAAQEAIRYGKKRGFSPCINVDVGHFRSGIWFGAACNLPPEAHGPASYIARVYFRKQSNGDIVVDYIVLPDWIKAKV